MVAVDSTQVNTLISIYQRDNTNKRVGKCAGPVVAQERDGGCGHGDATPNANAAKALAARYVLEGAF
jgi:hypothetical protein